MTVGIAATKANGYLNVLRNTADAAIASVTLKMHTADPGSAGTTALSQNTAGGGLSSAVTWSAAAGGSMSYATGGLFSSVAGLSAPTSETITHISLWSGATFLWSVALSSSKTISNGDSLQITALTLAMTPVAA